MSETKNLKLFKHDEPLEINKNQFDIDKALNSNWDKIDNYVGEANNKIDILETDNTTNKTEIANLKADNETNKSNIEELQEDIEEIDLIANMIPTLETEEAEELNVKSSKYYGKLDLKGNTSQEVRSGKNLLNVPSNLVISVYKEIQINLKANNTYTLKFENAIAGADNNQSLITFRNTIDIVSRIINTTTTKEITVQPEQDVTNIRIYASTDYAQSAGKTKTFEKLMVYEGTEEEEYEEYGVSPSTKYPSKIHNVEGNVEINICNKNWVNYKEAETYRTQDTIEIIENGVKWSGNYYFQIPVRLQIGKKYVFSCVSEDFGNWTIKYKDGTNAGLVVGGVAIQIEKETDYIYIYKKDPETLKENMLFTNIQLELEETITDYVENEEQEIIFPLQEGQKLYKGSYPGQENIHHVRKQVEFDGTEDWMLEEDENYFDYVYSVNFPDCKIGWQKSICTHFKNVNGSYAVNIGKVGYYSDYTNTRKYFCTDKATLQKWKEWLAEQKQAGKPVTVEYELEQEETEEMTEQQKEAHKQLQKIMTYYPETNVTNNQKALMKLTYKMNLSDAIVALQKLSIG